jgi:hypothetical protein
MNSSPPQRNTITPGHLMSYVDRECNRLESLLVILELIFT